MSRQDSIRSDTPAGISGERPSIPAKLLSQCYGDMRVLARKIMAGNALAKEFQPTELANEVAIRLIRAKLTDVSDQGHFLALAARTMRQVLIDEARKLGAAKRNTPMFMTVWPDGAGDDLIDIGALDRALAGLAALSTIRAEIVELRFMLGMTVKETAVALGLSDRTVNRHWLEARAWLMDHVRAHADDGFG